MKENMNRVLDIPLKITAVIGSTRMTLKELMALEKGTIIELDSLDEQEVELYVNGKKFAHGQVVTSNQNFGIRILSVLNEKELVDTLS